MIASFQKGCLATFAAEIKHLFLSKEDEFRSPGINRFATGLVNDLSREADGFWRIKFMGNLGHVPAMGHLGNPLGEIMRKLYLHALRRFPMIHTAVF